MRPWIVGDDCVHFQQPEKKDEPQPQFERRHGVQHVVAVVQVVGLLQPERPGHRQIVALVGQHAFGDGSRTGVVVVGGSNQIAGVPFMDQFQHQPAREEGKIVGMWLNGGQHLPRMWFTRLSALDLNFRGGKRSFIGHRIPGGNGERAARNSRNKLTTLHRIAS